MSDINAMTATTVANAIPKWWVEDLIINAGNDAFFGKIFTGKEGTTNPIIEKQELTKTAGDTLHFQTRSNLEAAGITGGGDGNLLEGREDQFTIGQFDVTLDYIENAVGITRKAKDQSLKGVVSGITKGLEEWLARKISDDVFKATLVTATTGKTIKYGAGRANLAALTTADVLTPDDIDSAKLAYDTQGGMPFMVKKSSGQMEPWVCMVVDEHSYYQLRGNTDIKNALMYGWNRGETNPLFSAAAFPWNGVLIFRHPPNIGLKGNYLRPQVIFGSNDSTTKAWFGVSGMAADPSPDVIDYLRYLPASGYVTNGTVITAYTAKTSGKENFSLDGDFSSASWVNGDTAYLCNASGVLYSRLLMFGGQMCARGWGKHPFLTENKQSYGQREGVGICACYGVSAIKDTANKYPNFLELDVASPVV